MQNVATTVIALILAVVLILVIPLMTLTERNDNVTQEKVSQIVQEFVTDVRNTGTITKAKYQNLESELSTTGNTYDIGLEFQILDENPGKKNEQASYTKIGENVYYTEYTAQILDKLNTEEGKITLKQGDFIKVEVKNENSTAAQTLKSSLLNFFGGDQYAISATSSGMIDVNAAQ